MEASTDRAEKIQPSSPPYLLLFFLVLVSFSSAITGAASADDDGTLPPLPQSEVEALSKIGARLGMDIGEWNVTVRNCSALDGVALNASTSDSFNKVTCNCSYMRSTVCHVTSIQLTRQNLTGMLPEEVVNLTYLRNLDLSQNYLSGPIPAVWASLQVFNLSLQGNRISGKIPKELGKMPLIKSLQVESNQLGGFIPIEIGDLSSLETLIISSNRFIGELPSSFAKLVKMNDFRMDGNNISGKIPEFIKNWISVNRIDMVGTSLVGPIPESITLLKNLTQLRVSDLQGPQGMGFPKLQNAKQLTKLVLRNCLISGEIPSYIGTLENLKVLDLSFNHLSGIIPLNFEELEALEYLYLTNNMLTGEIPPWMLRNRASNKINIDLSYNNFTGTAPSDCQEGNVNMVASFSSTYDDSITECLRKEFPCSTKPQYTSLFINCGGQNVSFEGNEYDKDTSQIGSSRFNLDKSERWAYSSTGDFTGNEDANFIATNTSILNMTNPDLYTEARLTPISLKYYGLCLENGNYSVKLHFAEIIFTNDETYWSLGKRLFDVLIQ
ncbi:putative Kinase, partial [Zostera marina]